MRRPLFRDATATRFLSRYWQKRPLLVRQAIPGFRGFLSREDVVALAVRDDVESRLVRHERGRWTLEHGPFLRRDLQALPARNWTLLVQGVNLHVAAADALLRRFCFLPYARLDDVMVSCAAPGGGVGPHVDSYDVFLLQGDGRRRWRIGRQRDLALRRDLPLKILARFRPQHECVLEPGDMLYLPPEVAHDGVAIEACTTYSIGFRAPSAQELAIAFLDWLRDSVGLEGRYRDPDPSVPRGPARIGRDLHDYAEATLARLEWDRRAVGRFLGTFLTEPKPTISFSPPRRPLSRRAFAARAERAGLRLDSRTQLLYDATRLFANGEALDAPPGRTRVALRRLANARMLAPRTMPDSAVDVLYRWYRDGFLHIG